MIFLFSKVLWNVRRLDVLIEKVVPVHSCEIWGFFYVFKGGFDGSNFWILLKKKLKDLFCLFVDEWTLREMDGFSLDFFHYNIRIVILFSKGKFTEEKFVEKDAQRPNVSFKRVTTGLESLGSHVMRGTD